MSIFLIIVLLVSTILTFSLLPDEHDKWSVLEDDELKNESKTKLQRKEMLVKMDTSKDNQIRVIQLMNIEKDVTEQKLKELSALPPLEINSTNDVMFLLKEYASPYNPHALNYYIVYEPPTNNEDGCVVVDFTDEGKYSPFTFASREIANKAIEVIGRGNLIKYYFGE